MCEMHRMREGESMLEWVKEWVKECEYKQNGKSADIPYFSIHTGWLCEVHAQ